MNTNGTINIGRSDIEDFLYKEARLLDEWRLPEWFELLTDDANYLVPTNDAPHADHRTALFLIADDYPRIRARVKRLMSPDAHDEFPHSHTRRIIGNVEIIGQTDETMDVTANFIVHRYKRYEHVCSYTGRYEYKLRKLEDGKLKISIRKAILDSEELGSAGTLGIIL